MDKQNRYDSLFQYYGAEYSIDWRLLKCQAIQESGLDPDARSEVGALGLMQFMPHTWNEWADGKPGIYNLPIRELRGFKHPQDPEDSICSGAAYMRWLMDRFSSKDVDIIPMALAAYNWGIGNVLRAKHDYDWELGDISKRANCYSREKATSWILRQAPKETQEYVQKVTASYMSTHANE